VCVREGEGEQARGERETGGVGGWGIEAASGTAAAAAAAAKPVLRWLLWTCSREKER
jgi:hypothetical protein